MAAHTQSAEQKVGDRESENDWYLFISPPSLLLSFGKRL